jgi:hypothetical protein
MLFFTDTTKRPWTAVLCGVLALAVLVAMLVSPAGSGRPSMWRANILARGGFDALYTDAFAAERLPDSSRDWAVAMAQKFRGNLKKLFSLRGFSDRWLERTAMAFLLSGIPLGVWLWVRKRDAFGLGVAGAVSLLLLVTLCAYDLSYYRGIRSLLLLQPFVAVLWGIVVEPLTRARGKIVRSLPGLLCFFAGVTTAGYVLWQDVSVNAQTRENTAFLESIVGGDQRMVVSPYSLSLDYVNKHYPQPWAFVPENCPTMQLLDDRYSIGTLIFPVQPGVGVERGFCGTKLAFDEEKVWRGTRYWVFRDNRLGSALNQVLREHR